jgi:hypothetical protein
MIPVYTNIYINIISMCIETVMLYWETIMIHLKEYLGFSCFIEWIIDIIIYLVGRNKINSY